MSPIIRRFQEPPRGGFAETISCASCSRPVVARCSEGKDRGRRGFRDRRQHYRGGRASTASVAKVEDLDPTSSRAVAEYLSVLDDAAFGGATPIEPKVISPTDPGRPLHRFGQLRRRLCLFRQLPRRSEACCDRVDVEGDDDHSPGQKSARPKQCSTARLNSSTSSRRAWSPMGATARPRWSRPDWLDEARDRAAREPDRQGRAYGTEPSPASRLRIRSRKRPLRLPRRPRKLKIPPRFRAKPRDGLTKDGTMIYFARKHRLRRLRIQAQVLPERSTSNLARSVHEAAPSTRSTTIAKTKTYAITSCLPNERRSRSFVLAHLKRILRLGQVRLPRSPERSQGRRSC